MTEAVQQALTTQPKAGIMEKAVCIRVSFSKPGMTRKCRQQVHVSVPNSGTEELFEGAPSDETTEAVPVINERIHTDLKLLRVSKRIWDCPEIKAIRSFDTEVSNYMRSKALPSKFSSGLYLVAIPVVTEVYHILEQMQARRAELVKAAVEAYTRILADDKLKLADMHNPRDYPPLEKFQLSFGMEFAVESYGVSDKLREISIELFRQEQGKAEARLLDASEEIQTALRVAMAGLVDGMVDRLTGNDGKPKKFKDASITKFNDFLNSFAQRNITEDAQLDALVGKAKLLLDGLDAEKIKESEVVQDRLKSGFEDVKKDLDAMLENQPVRRFRFTEEDEDVEAVVQ